MRMVIIGGGLAGGNVAVRLREKGFEGEIVILSDEPGIPFGRPPLSKGYLRQEEDIWLVKPSDWYRSNDVQLEPHSPVLAIKASGRKVVLADKEISCDGICIATGCRAKVPRLPGIDLEGIFPLRTQADSDAIRAEAKKPGAKAVVVGMSFTGAEVAASLRQLGTEVASVFPGTGPMSSLLGEEVSDRLTEIHRARGVQLHSNQRVSGFEGNRRVESVRTDSGLKIDCTFVVIGLGTLPNVEFLKGSDIAVDDGVVVDACCQTNVPGVFAAGDVARHNHPLFGPIRVEHYNNAEKQGRHVAGSMLGKAEPYDYVHSLWSDQYDHKLEYVGYAAEWDRFVMKGGRELLGFYLAGNTVKAAVGLDRGGDPEADPDSELAACAELIRSGTKVDPAELADNDSLLPSG